MDIRHLPGRKPGERIVECTGCSRRYSGLDLIGLRCPHCGEPLEDISAIADEPMPETPIVEVYEAPDMWRAELLREMLEAEGIRTAFRSQTTWSVLTFTIDGPGSVSILVLEPDAERARMLIHDYLAQVGTQQPLEINVDEEEEGEP